MMQGWERERRRELEWEWGQGQGRRMVLEQQLKLAEREVLREVGEQELRWTRQSR